MADSGLSDSPQTRESGHFPHEPHDAATPGASVMDLTSDLFTYGMLRFAIDMACVAAFALSGVLAARDRKAELDVFGVVVVAVVTAIGGGTLRDVLLDVPVFWLEDTSFIYCPILAGLVGFVLTRGKPHPNIDLMVTVCDAIGLAYFSVLGTQKALQIGMGPVTSVLMGLMTGICGGMMRDTYTGQVPFVMRKNGEFYATPTLIGCIIVVNVPGTNGLWIGGTVCLALRLAAVRWKLKLPGVSW